MKQLLLFLLMTIGLGIHACTSERTTVDRDTTLDTDGPAERAGENVDDAARRTGDTIERGVEKTGDKIEDAGDKIEDTTR